MSETRSLVPDLIWRTFNDPKATAYRILDLELPTDALWQALVLVAILSGIAVQLSIFAAFGAAPDLRDELNPGPMTGVLTSPMVWTLVQGCSSVVMVFAIHWIGRSFGGGGDFEGALALTVWLQFILVCFQAVQVAVALVAPGVADLIALASIIAGLWLLTQFVMALHGFDRAGMVLMGIIGAFFGVAFGLSIILALLGVTASGELVDV